MEKSDYQVKLVKAICEIEDKELLEKLLVVVNKYLKNVKTKPLKDTEDNKDILDSLESWLV